MKILSTIYHLPFTPLQNNAMLWRIVNLQKILEKKGNQVDLVYFTSKYLRETNLQADDLHRIYQNSSFLPQLSYASCLMKHDYDCIFANTSWAGFHSICGKKVTGTPLIVDCHGIPSEEFIMNNSSTNIPDFFRFFILKSVDKWALKNADLVTCVSEKMTEYLEENCGVPPEKMCVIPNGVDMDFFQYNGKNTSQLKEELGLKDKMVFGYIGGFQKWQGIDQFIHAARNMQSDKLGFLLVGGAENYQKNNLVSVSRIPRDEIPHYYSLCDVLVLPRPFHPATAVAAPTKFGEYAAMGKPILTTDVGDASQFVLKYKNGLVVDGVDGIEKGIMDLSARDDDELIEMGKNSRVLAESEFKWEILADRLDSCVKEVLA